MAMLSRRMLRRTLPHQVEEVHARLKRAQRARCSLLEHPVGNVVKQMTLELEVDHEVDVSLVPNRRKRPHVCEVLQRSIDGVHSYLSRTIQRDLARKALLKRTESDDKTGDDFLLRLAKNASAAAPGDERGIIPYVRDDFKKLVGTVGERRLLLVTWHVVPLRLYVPLAACRMV